MTLHTTLSPPTPPRLSPQTLSPPTPPTLSPQTLSATDAADALTADALSSDAADALARDPDGAETPQGHIGRRTFLIGAGAAGGAAAIDAAAAQAKLITNPKLSAQLPTAVQNVLGEIQSLITTGTPNFTVAMRRREDFLYLVVNGYNLIRSGQHLHARFAGRPAYLVFTFEPQHVTEQAYPDGTAAGKPGASHALMAYPSRIAFSVPKGKKLPLTVAGLLDWATLQANLSPSAAYEPSNRGLFLVEPAIAKTNPGPVRSTPLPSPTHVKTSGKPPKLANPNNVETAIELPWRLVISPTAGGQWSHPTDPITSQGFTELWHTRLAASADEAAADGGAIRAIWNYDTQSNGKPTLAKGTPPSASDESPFITSLTEFDRWEIVNATSNFKLSGRADVQANRLWLSARGGFLDSVGDWDSTAFDLAEWKHQATLGRDQYVKVTLKGFLFPFGHRAVYTVVTEREFEEVNGETVATLRQYSYVVIREPSLSYDPSDTYGIANNSRDFPFRELTIKTLRTPSITTPPPAFVTGSAFEGNPFVPIVNGAPFQFHFVGTDWVGQQSAFTAPAVFVYQQDGFNAANCTTVRNAYNGLAVTDARRIGTFDGKEVAFAASNTAGDTNLGVQSMVFGAGAGTAPTTGGAQNAFVSHDQPLCYPNLAQANVVLSAAAQAAGGGSALSNPAVSYHPTFVTNDFNSAANKGNVYLSILSGAPNLQFGSGSSGGVITPNLALSGLSRSLGPVAGDLDSLLAGKFDPTSVFDNALNATILGGVKLKDLIAVVEDLTGDDPSSQAMKIVSSVVDSATDALSGNARRHDSLSPRVTPPIPTKRTTHFHWEPDISAAQSVPIVTATANTSFVLDGVVTADLLNPKNSTFSLTGDLQGFRRQPDGGRRLRRVHHDQLQLVGVQVRQRAEGLGHRRHRVSELRRSAAVHRAARAASWISPATAARRSTVDADRHQRRPVGPDSDDRRRRVRAVEHRDRCRLQPAVHLRSRPVPVLDLDPGQPVHVVGRRSSAAAASSGSRSAPTASS